MTTTQAHTLLDERREGADIPPHIIDNALKLTGDTLPFNRAPRNPEAPASAYQSETGYV